MPEAVRDAFGTALRGVQCGDMPHRVRRFGEGVSREVLRMACDHAGETYRLAFSITLPGVVYVLHVFQKKSHAGRATPARDLAMIEHRWQSARAEAAGGRN
jgi:phage-related protein